MLISVIVPVYNASKYLKRCVDSILFNAPKECEILLINDGSTDNSEEICKELEKKDKRIRLLNKNNEGVAKAREYGINNSIGEYLMFVDADDTVSESFFDIVVPQLKYDVIRFGYNLVSSNNSKEFLPNEKGIYLRKDIEENVFPNLIQNKKGYYYTPALWVHVIKRELFISNMIVDSRIKIGEDGACIIPSIYHATSICFIDKCLYNYYVNEQSATNKKKVLRWEDSLDICNHLSNKIDINTFDFQEQLYRKAVHELFHVVSSQFYEKGGFFKNRKIVIENIKKYPLYVTSIKLARFSSLKGRALRFALRYHLFLLFKMYSIIK